MNWLINKGSQFAILSFVIISIIGCDFFYPTRRLDADPEILYLDSSNYFVDIASRTLLKGNPFGMSEVIEENIDSVYSRNNADLFYSKNGKFFIVRDSVTMVYSSGLPVNSWVVLK